MEELLQILKERLLGAKLDDCISSSAYRDIASLITEIEQLNKHDVGRSLPHETEIEAAIAYEFFSLMLHQEFSIYWKHNNISNNPAIARL